MSELVQDLLVLRQPKPLRKILQAVSVQLGIVDDSPERRALNGDDLPRRIPRTLEQRQNLFSAPQRPQEPEAAFKRRERPQARLKMKLRVRYTILEQKIFPRSSISIVLNKFSVAKYSLRSKSFFSSRNVS